MAAAVSFAFSPTRHSPGKLHGTLSSYLGSPFSFAPDSLEKVKQGKAKEIYTEIKEKHILGRAARPRHLPLPSLPLWGRCRHHSSSGGVSITTYPTFVPGKKVMTASIAISSSDIALAEGPLGCFHMHAFQSPSTSFFSKGPRPYTLATKWDRDCRSLLLHWLADPLMKVGSNHFVCPDRNW